MAEERQHPVLAVVGPPEVGKKALLSRILGRPFPDASQQPIWTIDNRYYSAAVQCTVNTASQTARPQDCEAIVLVFTADQQDSFAHCKQWASQADLSRTELRLCVANKCDRLAGSTPEAIAERQAWLDECREWCCDEMFEYIEVSAENPEVDENLADRDGESQGVKRVVSALHAHIWPGLQLKSDHPRNVQSSFDGTLEIPSASGAGGSAATGAEPQARNMLLRPAERTNGPVPSPATENGPLSAPDGRSSHAQSMQMSNGSHGGPSAPGMAGHEELASREGGGGSPRAQAEAGEATAAAETSVLSQAPAQPAGTAVDSDDEFENFERLLGQAAQARAQLQGLPDDQRREAAARLAMQFAQMLGEESAENELQAGGLT